MCDRNSDCKSELCEKQKCTRKGSSTPDTPEKGGLYSPCDHLKPHCMSGLKCTGKRCKPSEKATINADKRSVVGDICYNSWNCPDQTKCNNGILYPGICKSPEGAACRLESSKTTHILNMSKIQYPNTTTKYSSYEDYCTTFPPADGKINEWEDWCSGCQDSMSCARIERRMGQCVK